MFLSRWSLSVLAFTHLLTLGFMTLCMTGALMQMLPVLAGAVMPKPKLLGAIVHVMLTLGIVLLAYGFQFSSAGYLGVAGLVLGLGFAVYLLSVMFALVRSRLRNGTVVAMALAVASLVFTLALGLFMVYALLSPDSGLDIVRYTNTHLVWGLLGWVGFLVCGVAYQVVPMFQVTPNYPDWMMRALVPVVFAGLLIWTMLYAVPDLVPPLIARVWLLLCLTGFIAFSVMTILLQKRRKRRIKDVTRQFWLVGVLSVLLGGVLWAGGLVFENFSATRQYHFLLGVLLLLGFPVSVINGMLYKIVPFLVWFHLSNRRLFHGITSRFVVPNMKRIISFKRMNWQFRVHLAALAVLAIAALMPGWVVYAAGLLLTLSFLLLWLNLVQAMLLYRRCRRQMERAAGSSQV